MAANNIVMNAMNPNQTGWRLIYKGKWYSYPNPEVWHPYSGLNEQLGLDQRKTLTQEEFDSLTYGGVVGTDIKIDPGTLGDKGYKAIELIAKTAGANRETAQEIVSRAPTRSTDDLIQGANVAQRRIDLGMNPGQAYYSGVTSMPTAMPTSVATEVSGYEAPEFPEFPTTEQIVTDIMDAQQETIDRETKWLEQYQTENPFAFDEQLAKQSATAEYEPYYAELLEDYLSGMELKKETVQDEKKLLGELNRIQTGEATRAYERAVSQAEEGFAGQGMFYSGIKKKAMGEREVEYGAQEKERTERYGVEERGLERQTTALGLEEEVKRKELERGQQEAVETGVLQRRGEAMTQYYTPFLQAYKRQFPTGTSGIEGYLPETFLRY